VPRTNWGRAPSVKFGECHHKSIASHGERHAKLLLGDACTDSQRPGYDNGFARPVTIRNVAVNHWYRRNHASFGEQQPPFARTPEERINQLERVLATSTQNEFKSGTTVTSSK
jgi:hypothetical protein